MYELGIGFLPGVSDPVSTCARAGDWAAQWAVRREKEGADYWAASAKGGADWAAHHGGH
jgi:hypothetical protein